MNVSRWLSRVKLFRLNVILCLPAVSRGYDPACRMICNGFYIHTSGTMNFAAPENTLKGSAFRIRGDCTVAGRGCNIQDSECHMSCLIKNFGDSVTIRVPLKD